MVSSLGAEGVAFKDDGGEVSGGRRCSAGGGGAKNNEEGNDARNDAQGGAAGGGSQAIDSKAGSEFGDGSDRSSPADQDVFVRPPLAEGVSVGYAAARA